MDQSQITLSATPNPFQRHEQQPREDSTWRISILSTLGLQPTFGTMYSNNKVPPTPKEPQHVRRLVSKKDSDARESYNGHHRRWPGVLLLLLLVSGAIALVTINAQQAHTASVARSVAFERRVQHKRSIKDGKATDDDRNDAISDDGQIGNPKTYVTTTRTCAQPNYVSKNGQLYAEAPNGSIPFSIKGVNWFGMETPLAIPFGLWENMQNGTTAFEIAAFLARNNFNAVRLPLSVENILKNTPPNRNVINQQTNRAINITTYITTLQSIVQALAYRNIGVLLSMHALTNSKHGGNWFDPALGVTQESFLQAVEIVSTALCGAAYWNVIGLDLKNEPFDAEWGTGSSTDFVVGSERIAGVMLSKCPNWLAFVEGVVSTHTLTIDNMEMQYYDWWGGGLQGARTSKPTLSIPNKLVWAPHYYTTAVSPQTYFYGPQTTADFAQFEELDDAQLHQRVALTMRDMFGFLVDEKAGAVLLGEFAGLYAKDQHPRKTTKRTTDQTIAVMMEEGYAGGFMWSLNPESAYQYNPASAKGTYTEGLLLDDWLTPNTEFLDAFVPMDKLPNLRPLPCFAIEKATAKSLRG